MEKAKSSSILLAIEKSPPYFLEVLNFITVAFDPQLKMQFQKQVALATVFSSRCHSIHLSVAGVDLLREKNTAD